MKITLAGTPGSGKSTLVDLITLVLRSQSGNIFIDNNKVEDIDLSIWRGQIGYVSQETIMFNDTIANNICLWDEEKNQESVNKKIINASPYNPRMAYKYNINPKNKKEYLDSICNFKKLKVKFDKNEICENYYMQYMYFDKNWIFDDYSKMIKQVGSWDNQFSTKIYEYFNKNFNEYKIRNIYKRINNFYNSKKHQVSVKH